MEEIGNVVTMSGCIARPEEVNPQNVKGIICGADRYGYPLVCAKSLIIAKHDRNIGVKNPEEIDPQNAGIYLRNYHEFYGTPLTTIFQYVYSYRSKFNERWYIPSYFEAEQLLKSLPSINHTLEILGLPVFQIDEVLIAESCNDCNFAAKLLSPFEVSMVEQYGQMTQTVPFIDYNEIIDDHTL